jgi:replicative DNA helicase
MTSGLGKQTIDDIRAAERGILGCLIIDPLAIDVVTQSVSPKDFISVGFGDAYEQIIAYHAAGGPVSDVAAVVRLLVQTGVIKAIGGAQEAYEWTKAIPGSLNWYLKELRKAKALRSLDGLATEIRGYIDAGRDPEWVANYVDAQLSAIVRREDTEIATVGESANEALRKIEKSRTRGSDVGRSVGLPCVDAILGGLFDNDMIVLAARPSIGKTALGVQIGVSVAKQYGHVLLVDIAMRLIARFSGVPMGELRNAATMDDSDFYRVGESVKDLAAVNMAMMANRNVTISKIRAAAKLQKATNGLELIIIDYIGLIKSADFRKPRYEQISEISSAIKDMAMELEVPVLVLCQLGRLADKEAPMLSHLRDSGAIEQDADVVMLLHRESKGSREAKLDIAKNRQGATGIVELNYEPTITTFTTQLSVPANKMGNYEPAFTEYEKNDPSGW